MTNKLNLEKRFLLNAPGEILVYGVHQYFDRTIMKKFISNGFSYKYIGDLVGLKCRKAVKNIWSWRMGKSGIPLHSLRSILGDNLAETSFSNLMFGQRRSKHKIRLPLLSEDLAYLAGLISGDGNIQQYFIRIVDEHKKNLQKANEILQRQFKLPTKLRNENERKWMLEINSRVVAEFFSKVLEVPIGSKEDIDVPLLIQNAQDKIKCAYIKGWMDAESSVEQWFKNNEIWYLRICFKIKTKKIWKWITDQFDTMNIKYSKFIDNEGSYRFQIIRKESVSNYMQKIGFSYPSKNEKIRILMEAKLRLYRTQ